MSKTELKTVFHHTAKDQRYYFGIFGMLVYIGIWVFSLSSPFLVLGLLYVQQYSVALGLLALMALQFAPIFRTIPSVKSFFFNSLSHYFHDISMQYEGDELPTAKPVGQRSPVIYTIVPHGIFTQGWAMVYLNKAFNTVRFLMAKPLYQSPFFRTLVTVCGKPSSADKPTMLKHMRRGEDIGLIPGGFEEASIHSDQVDRVYIKQRQGFIKYALEYGYHVAPVFTFGERQTFWNLQGFFKLRLWLNSFGLPGVFPWGLWWCPIVPKDVPLKIVIGAPLVLPKIDKPTKADVDHWHQKYIEKLQEMYETYKRPELGDTKLEIW